MNSLLADMTLKDLIPIAVAVISLIGVLASAFVAFLAMRHTAVSTRYKNYLDSYKIAKEAGLTTSEDEVWARKVVELISKDAQQRGIEIHVVASLISFGLCAWCWQSFKENLTALRWLWLGPALLFLFYGFDSFVRTFRVPFDWTKKKSPAANKSRRLEMEVKDDDSTIM